MSGTTWLVLLPIALLLEIALSSLDIPPGARFTVPLPAAYEPGFAAKTTVLDAVDEREPGFAAAVSVKAGMGGYLCSLVVLLGDVTVWASDHSVQKFAVQTLCQLQLTGDGQLRLTDGAEAVGWSATAERGAKALHLNSRTGNLVLLDAKNHTVWQSFTKPTDKLLPGQRLPLPSYLTASLPKISSAFYCFVLYSDKIAAYIYFGETRYSYWELTPSHNRSMAFARMDQSGLTMLDRRGRPVAQISPAVVKNAPVRFLALGDDGDLGLYFFDRRHKKFRASYKALVFCDLPLACGASGVCSVAGKCKDFSAYGVWPAQGGTVCNATASAEEQYMVEMRGVTTVLKTATPLVNVTTQQCVDLCMRNCSCAAALYVKGNATGDVNGVCSHYEITAGAREVIGGSHRYSYWVKVRKGRNYGQDDEEDDRAANIALTKVVVIFGVVDVTCLIVLTGVGVHYCFYLRKRPVDKHVIGEEDAGGDDGGAADPLNSNNNRGAVQN